MTNYHLHTAGFLLRLLEDYHTEEPPGSNCRDKNGTSHYTAQRLTVDIVYNNSRYEKKNVGIQSLGY